MPERANAGSRSADATRRGFTLIELLVVVAIVGVLSSAVLASMQRIRTKARDTAIKAEIQTLVHLIEINKVETGTYANFVTGWVGNSGGTNPNCASETFLGAHAAETRGICQKIEDLRMTPNNTFMHLGIHPVFGSTRNYAVMVLLNSGAWYCVGSSGRKYESTSAHPATPAPPLFPPNPVNYIYWGGTGCYANP